MSVHARPYAEREGSEIQPYPAFQVEYRDASHRYWIHHGTQRSPVASVTSVLKVLDKPALLNWAEACGVEGALILERRGELRDIEPADAVDIVRINGLGKDRKRDRGADRGTAVHEALRRWAQEGEMPRPDVFPAEVRGYVQGLVSWLKLASPEPVITERIVGSLEHMFAGRLDLIANIGGRRTLVDLKTNPAGRVYSEASVQCAGYALTLAECEIEPVDRQVIVAVGAAGEFQQADCCAEPRDFLAVLACHRAMSRVRSAVSAAERLREAA